MIVYIIVAIVLYFVFVNRTAKETFVADDAQSQLGRKIADFVKADTTYSEYLDFLVKHTNKSYKLLQQDTFYELKFLQRGNKLTLGTVMQFMNDV